MQGKKSIIMLVVTIIAVLVVAAIAIRGVTANGAINEADDTTAELVRTQEESTLRLQVSQWQMSSRLTTTLKSYLAKEYGEDKVQLNANRSITVETTTGNKYMVKESGEVTSLD